MKRQQEQECEWSPKGRVLRTFAKKKKKSICLFVYMYTHMYIYTIACNRHIVFYIYI